MLQPLEKISDPKLLLAFDYDGTLSVPEFQNPPVDPHFFNCIKYLRKRHNAVWGICTGRTMIHMYDGFTEARFPFVPDFIVARERDLLFPNHLGRFVDDKVWLKESEKKHAKLFKKSKKVFKQVQEFITSETQGRWVSEPTDPAGIITKTEEEMDRVVEFLKTLKMPDELSHERNSIYFRFSHSDYSKGTCLREIGRRLGLPAEKTMAAGDNYNDLSMLNSEVARAVICPGNAKSEVIAHVQKLGGTVGQGKGSVGIMQAMSRYFA